MPNLCYLFPNAQRLKPDAVIFLMLLGPRLQASLFNYARQAAGTTEKKQSLLPGVLFHKSRLQGILSPIVVSRLEKRY